jgi:hypothetical protein
MMLSIGTRYRFANPKTLYEGSPSNAESVTDKIAPGYIYEFQFTVDPAVKKEDLDKAYDLLMALESRIPGIGVNYMGISDDGKTVIFQVFDPPVAPEIIGLILKVVAAVVVAVFAYLIIVNIKAITELIMGKLPTPPPWTGGLFWTGLSIILIGGGIYLASRAIKK